MSSSLSDAYDFVTHVIEFAVENNPLQVANTHLQMAA